MPLIRRKWVDSSKSCEIKRKFKKLPNRFGAISKLCNQDKMLLTLMKIKLELLEQDLASRFEISISVVSIIFITWVKGLSSVLKHLLFMPEQGSLNPTKPKRFNQVHGIHSIIDGSEIFMETPKSIDLQKLTWSEYKHQNPIKILVAVTPSSSICFVSKTYPGLISDKKITNDYQ